MTGTCSVRSQNVSVSLGGPGRLVGARQMDWRKM